MKKIVRLALILFALGLIAGAAAVWTLSRPYQPPGETFVRIERGSSTAAIARTLQKTGVIQYEWQLLLARSLNPSAMLQAGEYRFAEPSSVLTVCDRLRRGDIYYFDLTVPEGSNRFDIAKIAAATTGTISNDDFLKASADPAAILDLAPHAPSLEGFLFPSTYRLSHSTTAVDLCHIMTSEFRRRWKKLAPSLEADVLRVVTIASLVEKETGVAEERKIVAGVFSNRIAKGMRLDCDPTTIYAALLDNRYTGVIHKSDLLSQSPYNTYRNVGPPPGPIANPGAASLEASLHPAATDYLFFVAKAEGGGHVFSATRAAHEKAVLSYRHAKHKAG